MHYHLVAVQSFYDGVLYRIIGASSSYLIENLMMTLNGSVLYLEEIPVRLRLDISQATAQFPINNRLCGSPAPLHVSKPLAPFAPGLDVQFDHFHPQQVFWGG